MTRSEDFEGRKSRLVLVDGSQLLRDMLTRVFRKLPDFEIVAMVEDLAELDRVLESIETDWLVISTMPDNGFSREIQAVRARFPSVRLLAIAADGSQVLINWMEPQEAHMEGATLPELIAMMRRPRQLATG